MQSQFCYQYLIELFVNILNKKAALFDLSILDKKTLEYFYFSNAFSNQISSISSELD